MARGSRTLGLALSPMLLLAWMTSAPAQDKGTKTEPTQKPAYLKVLLSHANATLKIDDTATTQRGTTRTFITPPLDVGKRYSYTLTAFWEPNNYTKITRARDVIIEAGKEAVLDLTKADEKKPDDILIRYVPTPNEVVEAMLKLADVKKDDVVYDLGCGDGRIVITAVEKNKAKRGVGIDIDPERIKDSKANAKAAGVEDKLDFRTQDVLKIDDFADASVVMLYMGNDLNLALRPILKKVLKPGTRVVSHRFTMGDWKENKKIEVTDAAGTKYQLYLWIIGDDKAP